MNYVDFYYTIPDSDFYKALILLIFGLFLCVGSLFIIISCIKELNNPKRKPLLVLSETNIIVPQKVRGDPLKKDIVIPWNHIVCIEREDYSTGWKHRKHHSQLKIYADTGQGKIELIASINMHYFNVSEIKLFSKIRTFYSGHIFKEVRRKKFKVLASIAPDQLIWGYHNPASCSQCHDQKSNLHKEH